MKKIIFLCTIVILSFVRLNAQRTSFSRGDIVLNLGAGFGSTWYSGTYYKSQMPPISASVEIGVADHVIEQGSIGVGPYAGYSTFKFEKDEGGYDYSNILVGLRGNFHYHLVKNLDTYFSLLLGYNILISTEFGIPLGPPETGRIRSSLYVGGRYYIAEMFALMAEVGYGITYLNFGIALKF